MLQKPGLKVDVKTINKAIQFLCLFLITNKWVNIWPWKWDCLTIDICLASLCSIAGRRSAQQSNDTPTTAQQYGQKRKHFEIDKDNEELQQAPKRPVNIDLFDGLKYNKIVIFLNGGRNCIQLSAQRSNVAYVEREVRAENNTK